MTLKRALILLLSVLLCGTTLLACNGPEATNTSSEIPSEDSSMSEESTAEEVKMPEYWGFNNYENFTNPNAPAEILSHKTVVTKVSEKKYSMQSETEAGKVTITLEQRPWGMFNLWAWNLVDKTNQTHVFLVGATDLEYVFRTVYNGKTFFSGGNHGGEALVSIDLYNAETGEALNLKTGESVTVNSLHIIEKSKLLFIPDYNGDSISDYDGVNIKEYTEDQVYANVTRKYTFTGPQVKLNTDFTYVKDTDHYYSYLTMFPINKKYGLWCDMIDRDGNVIKTIETLKVGAADYSGPQYSGNAATRVRLYGYKDPRYQFDVRINTPTDSLGNSQNEFKTSIWDMNTSDNKVYFSKYPTNSSYREKAGNEVHTETIWLFNYVEDATLPEGSEVAKPFEEVKPEGTLVSTNKEYTVSGNGVGYGNYTARLTDGKATGGLTYDANWFGLIQTAGNNTVNGVGSFVIDLGSSVDLSTVRAHICNAGESGITKPAKITAYASEDGNSFTELGNLAVNDVENATYWTGLLVDGVSARYVKFDIQLEGLFCFLDELEVYSK